MISMMSKYLNAPVNGLPVTELIDNPPFPCLLTATVQGMDENGEMFEAKVSLDGHLNGDLYMRLSRSVELHSGLFIVLRLAPTLDDRLPALRIALHGRIDSVERSLTGLFEVRVAVLDYQRL